MPMKICLLCIILVLVLVSYSEATSRRVRQGVRFRSKAQKAKVVIRSDDEDSGEQDFSPDELAELLEEAPDAADSEELDTDVDLDELLEESADSDDDVIPSSRVQSSPETDDSHPAHADLSGLGEDVQKAIRELQHEHLEVTAEIASTENKISKSSSVAQKIAEHESKLKELKARIVEIEKEIKKAEVEGKIAVQQKKLDDLNALLTKLDEKKEALKEISKTIIARIAAFKAQISEGEGSRDFSQGASDSSSPEDEGDAAVADAKSAAEIVTLLEDALKKSAKLQTDSHEATVDRLKGFLDALKKKVGAEGQQTTPAGTTAPEPPAAPAAADAAFLELLV